LGRSLTDDVLAAIDRWPVDHAAAVVVGPDGSVLASHGDQDHRFELASVTKLLTATAVLVAVEEGSVSLDQPAGPKGSTLRHLLAHASGLGLDGGILSPPGRRRIYSNAGIEAAAATAEAGTEMPFSDYLAEGVLDPLGMGATALEGSPAHGATSTAADLARFAGELLAPRLLHPDTTRMATTVAFAGLRGVVPGFGTQDPNDWGLGFELRDGKHPHWTPAGASPSTFGHFGRSGSLLWVDPEAGLALVALTDRPFETWAKEAWPALGQDVLDAHL
jgi:CubicO group peptidase (beta-lactamase class C family)